MTGATEGGRSGVAADATPVIVAAEDPSDGFDCLQRVDVAVMLIQHNFFFFFFCKSSIGCKIVKGTV